MNKTLTTGILTLLLGLGIGYWYGKNSLLSEKTLLIDKEQLFNFNFKNVRTKPRRTDTIDYVSAKTLSDDFVERLDNAAGSGNDKIIAWPNDLHGWMLDAQKVQNILFDNNGGTKICNNIYVELGYDKTDGNTTLIFTGVNTTEKDGVFFDKKIHRKKDRDVWQSIIANTVKGGEGDNILEYVDPCKPRCPN